MASLLEQLGSALLSGEIEVVDLAAPLGPETPLIKLPPEIGKNTPMTLDTIVWIASMTKAITGAAAMQLVEKGKLSLDAPASSVVYDSSSRMPLATAKATTSGTARPPAATAARPASSPAWVPPLDVAWTTVRGRQPATSHCSASSANAIPGSPSSR